MPRRGLDTTCRQVARIIKTPPAIFMMPKSLPRRVTDRIVATSGSKAYSMLARPAEMYITLER